MESSYKEFMTSFANRVVSALRDKGLLSSRSKFGVEATQLAQAIGCSNQMARRYIRGDAMPDIFHIKKIADWLGIDPGFLLFGIQTSPPLQEGHEMVNLDYELLKKILSSSCQLFGQKIDNEEVVCFIMDIIYDASHLKADRETIIKMIDMAISSATKFSSTQNNGPSKHEKLRINS